MTSILKVDQIQTTAGAAPTATGLGLDTAGSVLQVKNTTTGVHQLTTNTRVDIFSLSITPSSTSSKILAVVNLADAGQNASGSTYGAAWLMRGSTDLLKFSGQFGYTGNSASNSIGSVSTSYLDSPSTTSSVTYKVQASNFASTATIEIGASNGISTFTLMEIAG
tara:strand:- start:392 stop:886 length:495 start_codon:yes stop_codon:yes gene_type:complete